MCTVNILYKKFTDSTPNKMHFIYYFMQFSQLYVFLRGFLPFRAGYFVEIL